MLRRSARTRITEYDAEISQYRASLKAGADPAVIGPWIAETQAKKVAAQAGMRAATGRHQMRPEPWESGGPGSPLERTTGEAAALRHRSRCAAPPGQHYVGDFAIWRSCGWVVWRQRSGRA